MFTRAFVLAALAATATAFSAGPALPLRTNVQARSAVTMSAEVSRRSVVEGAAVAGAAIVAAPMGASAATSDKKDFLSPDTYSKYYSGKNRDTAPIIQVHDERGCLRPRNEYKGAKAGTDDDEMCISVKARAIPASVTLAESILADFKIYCKNDTC